MSTMQFNSKEKISDFLSEQLNNGALGLFLGAGVSRSFDVSGWFNLLNDVRIHPKVNLNILPSIGSDGKKIAYSADALQEAADEVFFKLNEDEKLLIEVVSSVLYKGVDLEINFDFFSHRQLIAYSLLIAGGIKGKVETVITLNYDSLLEWYLQLFGCKTQSIYKLPYKKEKCDVEVLHPHGFIPLPSQITLSNSEDLILTGKQADRRLGNKDNPWADITSYHLRNKVFLFIGLSEATSGDRLLSPLLTVSHDECNRIMGVWVFVKDINDSIQNRLRSNGIIPIVLKEPGELEKFILEICRKSCLLIN